MSDVFKMFTGGLWKFVVSWLLPCVVFVAVFLVTLYPPFKRFGFVARLDKSVTASDALGVVVFAMTAFVIAAVLALNYAPVYRTLEGYTWPRALFLWGRRAQLKRRNSLADQINEATANAATAAENEQPHVAGFHATREAVLRERLSVYPRYEEDYLPSRLGNAMRAAERYGLDTYDLDTQAFWYELGTVTPESLQEDMQSARGMVDFFVSIVVLAGLYGVAAAGLAFWRLDWRYGIGTALGLLLSRFAYVRAANHALEIGKAQRAIVNVSRGKLAEVFGLALPASIDDERTMWSSLTEFANTGDPADAEALEAWKKPPAGIAGDGRRPTAVPPPEPDAGVGVNRTGG
ncbi:MAG TPA: hypothetical protein VF069_30035 [Streptosporangiaceae bacterium]